VDSGADWPISIISTQDVSGGARTWSTAGKSRATVVIKATFYMERGAPMRLVQPAPILLGDQYYEASPDRSIVAAADVAPYLPRAEVMFSGHAYAATPSPYMPVRLAVVGSRPLVDKSLHVFGERMWLEGDQATAPVPFTRIPIRYERSPRGYEENPIGMPQGPNLPVANIIDPHDPHAAAGFGAIPPSWPSRLRLLRGLDPALLDAPSPVLPDAFAWSYFHAAPADQRCSFFEGNEWVVLEGLHPDFPRMESQLPSARAQARVYGIESTGYREIGLSADTMWIDGDRLLCCVVWRGNFELDTDTALSSLQVFAGLEMPGRSIPWPGASAVREARRSELPAAHATPMSPVREATPLPGSQREPPRAPTPPPMDVGYHHSDAPPTVTAASQPLPAPAPLPVDAAPAAPAPMFRAGATLASPALQDAARRAVDASLGQGVVIQDAPPLDPTAAPGWSRSAAPSMNVPTRQLLAVDGTGPSSTPSLSTTMPQPTSQLERLIHAAAAPSDAEPQTHAQPAASFDDAPTFAPDTGDIARIVAEAEATAGPPSPTGQRPSPVALRPMKTTIRGLGAAASEPPPTARVDAQVAKSVFQTEEQPTAQLQVPDILLKLSDEPSKGPPSSSQSFAGPVSVPGPVTIHQPELIDDEEETGRPTLTNMEAPPISVTARPLVVHYGEMRVEVERRIREGESLAGLDLSDVDLTGFDLSGQRLAGCRLDRASMKGCRMRGIDLSGASLEGADLSEAQLDDAMLERTNLVSAKLVAASLKGAFLTDANLTTADARRAILDQASGQRTMLCRARLDGASLAGARLDGADLTEAQLDGAQLQAALLPELRAYEISAEDADFSRASLQNARFDGSVLGRARFDGVLAEDSMWDRAVLDGASLGGAKLTGASFTKASLRGARLVGADLSEARFNRAVLSGADVTGVELGNVTLDGADLTGLVTGT
jgi:uncharacterized protein YjbI with pentapeptide repeats